MTTQVELNLARPDAPKLLVELTSYDQLVLRSRGLNISGQPRYFTIEILMGNDGDYFAHITVALGVTIHVWITPEQAEQVHAAIPAIPFRDDRQPEPRAEATAC